MPADIGSSDGRKRDEGLDEPPASMLAGARTTHDSAP